MVKRRDDASNSGNLLRGRMKTEILYRPSYSMAVVKLDANELIYANAGAMVGMSSSVTMDTQASGGLLKSMARQFFGGASFWQNVFRSSAQGGEVQLSPVLPGDMFCIPLAGEGVLIQAGCYIASEETVMLDAKWTGLRTFMAAEGVTMLRASGQGQLLLSSYGAIFERQLTAGEGYTIDSGHLVAISEGMDFKVRPVGGLKATFLSGEGLVIEMVGPGRVLVQTRSTDSLVRWLRPRMGSRTRKE